MLGIFPGTRKHVGPPSRTCFAKPFPYLLRDSSRSSMGGWGSHVFGGSLEFPLSIFQTRNKAGFLGICEGHIFHWTTSHCLPLVGSYPGHSTGYPLWVSFTLKKIEPRFTPKSKVGIGCRCELRNPKRWCFFMVIQQYLSNEKNLGWLGYIGDYTTQLYRAL